MRTANVKALSPLIGRSKVLATLLDWLRRGERLITVTGTAGIGKTRLVHEVLARCAETTRDAHTFCDLTEARTEDDLWLLLSRTFGAENEPSQILRRIDEQGPTLLVLDNFEQLTQSSAHVVARLCESCAKLRVIVTTRSVLRVRGEIVYELSPLTIPSTAEDPSSESLELWCSRRMRSDARYRPGSEDTQALTAILSTLEGIPLAIELAAARASMLSTRELAERLKVRFLLLRKGLRDSSRRQATLEGAIAWSFQWLTSDELEVMTQCSVFRGGFTLEMAEHVIDRARLQDGGTILDLLQSVREQSLLRSETHEHGVRLSTFASIREYAEARLRERMDVEALYARHAAYFGARAEALSEAVDGPEGSSALDVLDRERDNLVAAAERAASDPEASAARLDDAARCLMGLDTVLWTRGPIGAHLTLWDGLIAEHVRKPRLAPVYACRTLEARGLALSGLGRGAEGLSDVEHALSIAESSHDPILLSRMLLGLSWIHMRVGHLSRMEEAVTRGRALSVTCGQRRLEGIFIDTQSVIEKERGELTRAENLSREALLVHREVGNRRWEGVALGRLAMLAMERGDVEAARSHAEAALAIHGALKSRYVEAVLWMTLAIAHYAHGDTERARELSRNALGMYRQVGEQRAEAVARAYLGAMSFELGEGEAALFDLEQGFEALIAARAHRSAVVFAFFLSGFEAHLGRFSRAHVHLERARAILREHPDARIEMVRKLIEAQVAVCEGVMPNETRARAEAALATAMAPATDGKVSVRSSVDVRLAARTLERALAERAPPVEPCAELRVHALGHWFARDGQERVALQNRPALRRILVRLASQRLQRPGVPLSAEQLVATGWPHEKMSRESASNRLYVTLNRLRGLGLRELLLADTGGYRLDARAFVRMSPADE